MRWKFLTKILNFIFSLESFFALGRKGWASNWSFLCFSASAWSSFSFSFSSSLSRFAKMAQKNLWVLWSNSCYMLLKFLCESVCVRVRACVCLHVCVCACVCVFVWDVSLGGRECLSFWCEMRMLSLEDQYKSKRERERKGERERESSIKVAVILL